MPPSPRSCLRPLLRPRPSSIGSRPSSKSRGSGRRLPSRSSPAALQLTPPGEDRQGPAGPAGTWSCPQTSARVWAVIDGRPGRAAVKRLLRPLLGDRNQFELVSRDSRTSASSFRERLSPPQGVATEAELCRTPRRRNPTLGSLGTTRGQK